MRLLRATRSLETRYGYNYDIFTIEVGTDLGELKVSIELKDIDFWRCNPDQIKAIICNFITETTAKKGKPLFIEPFERSKFLTDSQVYKLANLIYNELPPRNISQGIIPCTSEFNGFLIHLNSDLKVNLIDKNKYDTIMRDLRSYVAAVINHDFPKMAHYQRSISQQLKYSTKRESQWNSISKACSLGAALALGMFVFNVPTIPVLVVLFLLGRSYLSHLNAAFEEKKQDTAAWGRARQTEFNTVSKSIFKEFNAPADTAAAEDGIYIPSANPVF
jgi:hypothetical protein